MAAVSVAFDGSRISEAESETDGGTWDKWGATQSPTQETDFVYQNQYAISNKISSTTGGVDFDKNAPALDLETTPSAILAAIMVANYGGIDYTVAKGTAYQVGSGPSDYHEYYLHGLYNDYQKAGGWVLLVLDPNVAAYRDATTGTPDLTAVDYFGWWADMAGAAKSENVIHDTLSYFNVGSGLTLTGGSGSDADGTFQDFIDADEGTSTNSWGLVSSRSGVLFVLGVLTIGSATETDFADANKQIVFPDGLFDAGFCGLDIDLSNASSVITIADCQFVGRGREAVIEEFHTNDDVDGTDDEIDITGHAFETGDYVDYSKEGGTDAMGLTDGNDYWVRKVSADAISLHTTRQGAFADTSQVNLTASGGTETHRLTKLTDTRPDFEVSGTSGSATLDGCLFLNHRNVTFTSAASMNGGTIEAKLLTQNSADIENVKIVTSAIPGVATLQDPTFAETTDLHDCDFIQSAVGGLKGHAVELDTATSYSLYNIGFSGYGANGSDQAAIYVSATTGTVTINVIGGDTPTYRTAGATVSLVIQPVSTEITVKDQSGSVITGARVLVEAGDGTGDLPFEDSVTITRSGSTASVSHTAHGMSNGDKVVIRGANQQEYNGVFVISNVATDSYDYTVSGTPATPATGTIIASGVVVSGTTDGSGKVSNAMSFSVDQNVKGSVRKSTTPPYYKGVDFVDVVDKDTGLYKTVQLVLDQ